MIDEQRREHFVGHFVLPGKNAVLQPSLENFQIRQTRAAKGWAVKQARPSKKV